MESSPSLAPTSVVVLAAGAGRRMRSTRPKPLHRLCGRPMVRYVLDALEALTLDRVVVVVGHGGDRVAKELRDTKPVSDLVEQSVQRGTGDAVLAGLTAFVDDDLADGTEDDDVLVVPGDIPLLRGDELVRLVRAHRETGAAVTILTADEDEPTGRSRVIRAGRNDDIVKVVEHRDVVDDERDVTEVATGVYCFRRSLLAPALRRVHPDNSAGEIHLSGAVEVLAATGHAVIAHASDDAAETRGINDRVQLAGVEQELRRRTNAVWLSRGVTMLDPERTYLDATVQLAPDVTIFPGTILQGTTVVGEGCEIGPDTRLVDCIVGAGSRVEKTMGEHAIIGPDAHVGPFAVLTAGAEVPAATTTGPFYTAAAGSD